MWFVAIGLIMLVMNFAGIGPVGAWSWSDKWWAFLLPFACAIITWWIADSTGYYQRRAQKNMDQKKVDRRNKSLEQLGMLPKGKKKR